MTFTVTSGTLNSTIPYYTSEMTHNVLKCRLNPIHSLAQFCSDVNHRLRRSRYCSLFRSYDIFVGCVKFLVITCWNHYHFRCFVSTDFSLSISRTTVWRWFTMISDTSMNSRILYVWLFMLTFAYFLYFFHILSVSNSFCQWAWL